MRDQVRVLHLPIRLSLPVVPGHGAGGPARHRGPGGHALGRQEAAGHISSGGGKQVRCHIYLFINLFIETGVCATSVLYCKNILSCATIHPHYFKLQTLR